MARALFEEDPGLNDRRRSRLCLVLNGATLAQDIELLDRYRDKVDLVEVRADFLTPEELSALDRFPSFFDRPAILTVRRVCDGGSFRGSEAERSALYRRASGGDWAAVDLETDFTDRELASEFGRRGVRIIRSFHDFSGVPSDLVERVRQVAPGELPKAAVMPRTTAEVFRFLAACFRLRHREKIILAMGDFAVATRIVSAKIGSAISYCSLPAELGRIDPEIMYSVYRFPAITRRTRLFGVIGNPIAHSFSPFIHNKGFRDLDVDAVYVPFLVDDVAAFFRIARLLGVEGFSVTLPHKSAVIPHLKEADALCRSVGACNTVVRRGRSFYGYNTDVGGFLSPLRNYFPEKRFSSLRASVIGAGGAARAAAYALASAGAKLLILNRTPQKAAVLAAEFGAESGPLGTEGFQKMEDFADLIVQTTKMGMDPDIEGDPLVGYEFKGTEIVYDLVYTPRLTRLLQRALEKGCKVINGEEMFMAQAHEQFRLFTGLESTFKNSFIADFNQSVS
ncbi:MAG: shikimate dehydrogenase [Spirochaetales bacterium]|nr:shikimate dehydrogenase [Spirochaetales bacterium]